MGMCWEYKKVKMEICASDKKECVPTPQTSNDDDMLVII